MSIFQVIKSHHTMSFLVYGGAIILLMGALWFAYQYVDPAPPSKVTIASGSPSGAYYKYARKYSEFFAKQGITLEIIETNGSMDNLARMSSKVESVDAAFMQGGIATPDEYPDLRSLGSLYYEPLWVFYRTDVKLDKLIDLRGLRISIGPKGSGTNHVLKRILRENGVTEHNTQLYEGEAGPSIPQMLNGKLDAMFFIAGVKSQLIETLGKTTNQLRLYSFNRAEAYARSHHYLKRLILPQGAINLALDLPREDVSMLAPTANLVVKEDLHPAIKFLFLLAADEIHRKGDVFAMPGAFPNDTALLFPLTSEAENFYAKGAPLLMRYLPYRLAVTLERLKILLIPLLTLLYPLFKVTPPAYRWQIRRRIFKWYKHLKAVDIEAYDTTDPIKAKEMLEQLEELDRQVMDTSVPLSYTDYIYSLRIHIRMIERRLEKVIKETPIEDDKVI